MEEKKIEELNGFKDLRIVDNFYQTSSFFPMPTTEIGTLSESGQTNLGSYSLCFPYYIAGKDYYAMVLCCRNSSNTAKNILRTGKCSINFITDKRKYFKEAVRLGYPGETTEEKMKDCIFTLVDGKRARENPNEQFPKIPASKGISLDTVKYAASRLDPDVKFTDEACAKLVKVPRVFLNTVLKGCVAWAKENNVTLITEKEMEIIQDKRNKEKK